ncbi:hypothetical protein AAF712_009228 [Marasmius tenuissimus]|uniref:F-box domain-containing protein n=1 Tax=Marasmius tenuissimus TaxID=585030 RepID=A0ABR2ZRT1_9AGAR
MPPAQSKPLHESLPVPLEVHQRIINALPTKDLINYSLVSKTVHEAIRGIFRLETLLSPYFTSEQIIQFRAVQESTQFLISGSTAYAFFAREGYPESDLDLYVDQNGYHQLMNFLQSVGYGFEAIQVERKKQPSDLGEAIEQMEARVREDIVGPGLNELDGSPEDAYVLNEICDVFNFTRSGKRIQVIACSRNPLDVILSFHLTAVMNFITARHAISLYPKSTYVQGASIVNYQQISHREDVYQRYEDRGLKILSRPDRLANLEAGSAFDPCVDRQPGDRNCWVVSLVPHEISSINVDDIGPIRLHSWSFSCEYSPSVLLRTRHFEVLGNNYCPSYRALKAVGDHSGDVDDSATFLRGTHKRTFPKDHAYEISRVLRKGLTSALSQFPSQASFAPPDAWFLVYLRDVMVSIATDFPESFQITKCVFAPNRRKTIWVNVRVKISLTEGSAFDHTAYRLHDHHRAYCNVVVEDQNVDLVYRLDPMDYIDTREHLYCRPPPPPLLSALPFEF